MKGDILQVRDGAALEPGEQTEMTIRQIPVKMGRSKGELLIFISNQADHKLRMEARIVRDGWVELTIR